MGVGSNVSVGVDIGGTFTDIVVTDGADFTRITKIPSSRRDPSEPIATLFDALLPSWHVSSEQVVHFIHGTTVATNAVLERKGARLGILTTEGFEDVLEIGRQNRKDIYALIQTPETPVFLAPGARRLGVRELMDASGAVVVPLDLQSLDEQVRSLVDDGVNAIAICFLFSFLNSTHEQQAADFIRRQYPEIMVSLSCEVDPAFREYERTCVTAFDAYVKPGLDTYLGAIEDKLRRAGVGCAMHLMQSRGGTCSSNIARQRPVRLFLSGPAAGVIGASETGKLAAHSNIITVDIGGTSSDIALITGGRPGVRRAGWLDGYQVRVPMIDVNAVGAGGGSIARLDAGGGLRVGPESAGADPGPACYGRGGTEPTVTDASVILGLLDPDYFAGGTLQLDLDLAAKAIEMSIAKPMGLSIYEAALGIHRIANAQMAEGIRLVSVKRGIDPRDYALLPFGGAGALHATALANELGIDTIVFPRYPGVLSAAGLIASPVEHEVSGSYISNLANVDVIHLRTKFSGLERDCMALINADSIDRSTLETVFQVDMCFVGQSHYVEVTVDPQSDNLPRDLGESFARQYEALYGHYTAAPLRLINLRVVMRAARLGNIRTIAAIRDVAECKRIRTRPIMTEATSGFVEAELILRESIVPRQKISGPAIIEQTDTTILLDLGWDAVCNEHGILIAKRALT